MKIILLLLVVCSLQDSLACLCAWETPQEKFCRADFAIRGQVTSIENVYPSAESTQLSPKIPFAIKYLVLVKKIYKGADLIPAKNVEILTATSENMCGVTDLEVNGIYLLTGHMFEGEFKIGICDWIEKYDNLTSSQRKGLKTIYNNCDDTVYVE
ncbi:metalloproteinase inhibitor 3-like [Anneissia japonica]|uniref:metalloproteinase inhibitor 3-like n=1 Tax=Anneissia japonica TaxID=1529436 RepID=UPI001425B32B|nr:metalloproteinase inhibitor 3-like [Anneissia japonica]